MHFCCSLMLRIISIYLRAQTKIKVLSVSLFHLRLSFTLKSFGALALHTWLRAEAGHAEPMQEALRGHVTSVFWSAGACVSYSCDFKADCCQLLKAPADSHSFESGSLKKRCRPRLEPETDVQQIHSFQWWHVPHSQPKLDRFHNTAPREDKGGNNVL